MKKRKIVRIFYIVLGFISLGLGCVGIVLPIIPTTPFLLLTSFCFVRGSEKFNNWFLNTKIYKKHLENFASSRIMTLHGELILLIFVSLMIFMTMFLVNNLYASICLTILILIKYLYFILRITPVKRSVYKNVVLERERRKVSLESV